MPETFQVVDLFAGPGGLAEGFSALRDGVHQPFDIVLSVEKEQSAYSTLRLRAFLRQFDDEFPPEYYEYLNTIGSEPDWAALYPEEWANAGDEAIHVELGTPVGDQTVRRRLDAIRGVGAQTVVIGGPPCQAYSLVGRARNRAKVDYVPSEDKRHFLYQEYIDILARLQPVAFVMENVKGMLSSSVKGHRIFDKVLEDLTSAGGQERYSLFAIGRSTTGAMTLQRADDHRDYVVRAEHFGVPQARHRVIIVGIRHDLASRASRQNAATEKPTFAALRHVLAGMPPVRSGLSRGDSDLEWRTLVLQEMQKVCDTLDQGRDHAVPTTVRTLALKTARQFRLGHSTLARESHEPSRLPNDCPSALANWLSDPLLHRTLNHCSRRHMREDLGRYFFAAVFTNAVGRAPKATEFPLDLAPAHANWLSGMFSDRFRAQPWNAASSTVTSHLSKDGHYFIHPDAAQCRSFTVREAARLQTFPDNYLFLGNRTEQYVQVGNAVPPYLARQIAAALWTTLL